MRIIAHLDMDAFFAAVEERDKPRLKGLPIVVGADPRDGKGRGVVSTANYKAREYGIRSALPISKAWEFSEAARKQGKQPAVFLGGSFEKYREVSDRIMQIIQKYSSSVEEASVDEAYFDLTESGSYNAARKIALKIKQDIKKKEKLTCSIGIGPNKLIAKIASDMQKPNGLTIVEESGIKTFLHPLPIRKIPGIGPKTESILLQQKIHTIGDLQSLSQATLEKMFGQWGIDLYKKSRGIDESPIVEELEAKSIGEQETFPEDSFDSIYITKRMSALCAGVFERFKRSMFKTFKTVTITVRFSGFETKNRSQTLKEMASDIKTLEFEAFKLLAPFFDRRENPHKKKIRLIGVRVEKLT